MSVWLRRTLLLFGFYLVLRLAFFGFNFSVLRSLPASTLWEAFIAGFRFDAAMIATLNAPLALLHALRFFIETTSRRRWFDHGVGGLFVLVNIPFFVIGMVDAKLFTFTGRRTTPDFFGIAGDIGAQSVSILIQYGWLTLSGVILCGAFAYVSWQRSHHQATFWLRLQTTGQKSLVVVIVIAAVVLAARGGLQHKPLAPAHAYFYQPPVLANLVLNSTITLLRAPPTHAVVRYSNFSDLQEVRRILTPKANEGLEQLPLAPGKNIVMIIVESLASEYVGYLNQGKGYTPFLDSLMEKSVTFNDSFASGRRSIDAMPSIFAAVPAWRDQPYVTSPYSGNEIQALPRLLKIQGYETYFFHGASNGSMHFDVFSAMAGIDRYFGLNEYPSKGDRDGSWGVFDEPFLEFAAETLSKGKKPFMAGIFTLSSHNPFSIPEKYKGKFPKGTLPIHESIGYADYALGQFFAKAEKAPWFKNTLFVITGDHTSLTDRPGYDSVLGRFRVPIVFYDPTGSLPNIGKHKVAQHVDITPTLLDLLGLTPEYPTLSGWSLFDPSYKGRFIQYEYGHWYYYDRSTLLRLDAQEFVEEFSPGDLMMHHPQPPAPSAADEIEQLKAARQYFLNGMIDNAWHR